MITYFIGTMFIFISNESRYFVTFGEEVDTIKLIDNELIRDKVENANQTFNIKDVEALRLIKDDKIYEMR
jgi:hypothetical protein